MGRTILSFNREWSFHKGDIHLRNFKASHAERFDSSEWLKTGNMGLAKVGYPEDTTGNWRMVNLPHDFVIEEDFSSRANYVHGSLPVGIGWYRKEFFLEKDDENKRIFLEFDGIFRNSSVWVNGHYGGGHLSGYTSFSLDISELCYYGEANAVAIRVDASEFELWSYEGGGIYRDVRIVKTPAVFIPQWGAQVWTEMDEPVPDESGMPRAEKATIKGNISIANSLYKAVQGNLIWDIIDPEGIVVKTVSLEFSLDEEEKGDFEIESVLKNPALWSVDNPSLYISRFTIKTDNPKINQDRFEQKTGIRHFRFDANEGFFLNGVSLKLMGTCCHQDHGCVGAAVPPSLREWRVAKLKEMGSNAIRTSHNPADPALLDACDKLGMLVMDEQRMIGSSPEILGQLEDLVRRDRNHPSVIIWSLGNEEIVQHSQTALRIFRRMQSLVKRLDPTRVTTYAMNANWIETCDFYIENDFQFDVFGSNYRSGQRSEHYDEFHQKHPDWPLVGTETGGSASTRGIYEAPSGGNYALKIGNYGPCKNIQWTNPKREGIVSAYGETCTPWGYSVEETWKDCANRPFMAGTFLWTGFDYRGETFPYGWPSVITRYGIMDLCGFPKDAFYYFQAWWRRDIPMIHIFPHWDWRGREGENIEVWCYSNCYRVELFLNGKSLGANRMEAMGKIVWNIPFEAGTLEARGFDAKGQELVMKAIRTPETPAKVKLHWENPQNLSPRGDGESVFVINAVIVDAKGEWCQRSEHPVHFIVEGHGEFLGSGNGNPISLEKDSSRERNAYCGLAQIIIRAGIGAGRLTVKASSPGMEGDELFLELTDTSYRGFLDRCHVTTAEEEKKGEIDNLL